MVLRRRFVRPVLWIALCAFAAVTGSFAPPFGDAWARSLTSSEQELLDEYRKKQAERAEEEELWGTAKETAKDVMSYALDQAIGKLFKPLEVVPASGGIVDKIKPTSGGIYRYFIEEPWMKDMYNKYTGTLYKVKDTVIDERKKAKAELSRVDALLDALGDDDPDAKRLLEEEKGRLSRQIDASDELIDDLDLRLEAAQDAKDRFDAGGDVPDGFPTLLQNLNNEIKEMQDRRKRQAAEPEDTVDTSCIDLRQQQIEIEQKLYAEFQRRRNDPGMVLEAQRAQNEKLKLQAQMAHCAD